MGNLAGLWRLDGAEVGAYELERMRDQAVRSAGARPLWTDGAVGLVGASRAGEGAPTGGVSGRFVVAADARLDRTDELADAVGLGDDLDLGVEDLIAHAYARWGEGCPEHLSGGFAFVVWDRAEQTLFCARDPIGVRSLYYHYDGQRAFAFASRIGPLLSLPWIDRGLDDAKIADFLTQTNCEADRTFYRTIQHLAPAQCLLVGHEGMRRRTYWHLDVEREIRYGSDAEYQAHFRELFTRSVERRLEGANQPGALLSGGLDSSSVACVARDLLGARGDDGSPLKTVSLVFGEGSRSDEGRYIEAVVAQGGIEASYVDGLGMNPFADADAMLSELGGPFITPNLYLFWNTYRAAHQQGVDILLDGILGDDVVSHGTRYLTELAGKGRFLALANEVGSVASALGGRRRYSWRVLKEYVVRPLLAERVARVSRTVARRGPPETFATRFVNQDLLKSCDWRTRSRDYRASVARTSTTAREAHVRDLTSQTLPTGLEVGTQVAAAHGLSIRFPFADRDLMDFCLAIPVTQTYRSGWTRVIQREALRDHLPELVRRRYGKTYLHHAFYNNLFGAGADDLRSLMGERLDIAAPYLNVSDVRSQADRLLGQRLRGEGAPDFATGVVVWNAALLCRWLELQVG